MLTATVDEFNTANAILASCVRINTGDHISDSPLTHTSTFSTSNCTCSIKGVPVNTDLTGTYFHTSGAPCTTIIPATYPEPPDGPTTAADVISINTLCTGSDLVAQVNSKVNLNIAATDTTHVPVSVTSIYNDVSESSYTTGTRPTSFYSCTATHYDSSSVISTNKCISATSNFNCNNTMLIATISY